MRDDCFHVYIVEDHASQRDLIARYLEQHGLEVTAMASAEEMLRRIDRHRPDLVVLDLGLPGLDGLQACLKLRSEGDSLPIIVLTARSDELDRVLCLEVGADDYMSKPFSARELLARIRAVMRRAPTPATAVAARGKAENTVPIGRWELLLTERCLRGPDGIRALSGIEFALLAELARHPHKPLTRERLVAASHSRHNPVTLRAIDAAVMRLRRLVEPDPSSPMLIRTVRGHGYMFVPAPQTT